MSVVPHKWLSFKIKYYEIMEKYQTQIESLSEQLFSIEEGPVEERRLLYKEQAQLQIVKNIFSQFQCASLFYRYLDMPLDEIERRVEETISEREENYQRGMAPYYEEILFCACLQDELNYLRTFFTSSLEKEQLEQLIEKGDLRREEYLHPTSASFLPARNQFVFRHLKAMMYTYFRKCSVITIAQKINWDQILLYQGELENPSLSAIEEDFIEEMDQWMQKRISHLARRIELYQIRSLREKEYLDWGKDNYISHNKDGMWTFMLSPYDQRKKNQLEFCVEIYRRSIYCEEQVLAFHRDFLQDEGFSEIWDQVSFKERIQILEKDLFSVRQRVWSRSDLSCSRRFIHPDFVMRECVPPSIKNRKREHPLEPKDLSIMEPWIEYADCCKSLLNYYRSPIVLPSNEDRASFLELFEMVHPKSEEVTMRPVEKVKKCL